MHTLAALNDFADVAHAALEALKRGEFVVLASVMREGDSVPQHNKMHMLVWPDGRTFGTLSGGVSEGRVIADAQAALTERTSCLVNYKIDDTNPDSERVTIHFDVLHPDPTLLIIGAGHVAQPIATIGNLIGMRVCVVDDREEWANRERFPTAAEIAVIGYEPVNEILDPIPFLMTPATHVVITTWGYDLPAMEQALRGKSGRPLQDIRGKRIYSLFDQPPASVVTPEMA